MMLNQDKEKVIQYLFGELSEFERDLLEERIFSDDDFSLFLEATENDLVDEYVRNEMEFAQQEKFEKNYLISERRREKVSVAAVLQKEVFTEKEVVQPIRVEASPTFWESLTGLFKIPNLAWAGGMAAILLGVLIIGLIILRQNDKTIEYVKDDNSNQQIQIPTPPITPTVSPTAEIPTNQNSNQIINANNNNSESRKPDKKPTPTPTPTEKRETVAPTPEPRIFVATLLPVLRSGEQPTLQIPKKSQTVQLKIVHDNQKSFAKYRIDFRNQNGDLIFTRTISVNEKNLRRPLNLSLQNSQLKTGQYEITLSGIDQANFSEVIKFYNFTVNQK